MQKSLLASFALALSLSLSVAHAQEDAVTRANRSAYEASMKCFVAGGIAKGDADDLHDAVKSRYFEAKARLSFDTASQLGEKLGYSNTRINQDFGLAQSHELPNMVANTAYYKDAVATCKALGLM